MSKLGSDIRKVSGYEKLLKLAREAQETADQAKKLSIENRKHIALLDNKTLTTTSQNGTTGVTQPTGTTNHQTAANTIGEGGSGGGFGGNLWNAGTGTSLDANNGGQANANTQESPTNGHGSLGSNDDLGGDDNSQKEGQHDAESLVNNEKDGDSGDKEPPVPSGNTTQPGQNLNNQYTGEKINKITGGKTADDRKLVIGIGSIGAVAWVGPSDWDNAFIGPEDPTFEQGKVWKLSIGAQDIFGSTFTELINNAEVPEPPAFITKAYGVDTGSGEIIHIPPEAGDTILFSTDFTGEIEDPYAPLGGTIYEFEAYIPTDGISASHYGLQDCGLTAGDTDYCMLGDVIPLIENWTDLGVTQLGWISGIANDVVGFSKEYIGRFMPHPADVNVPEEYINGASILDFFGTKTDMPIRLGPLREGGFYLYERDPGNDNLPVGDPTENTVTIIRTNGTVAGRITPNQLATMLPL